MSAVYDVLEFLSKQRVECLSTGGKKDQLTSILQVDVRFVEASITPKI